MECINSLAVFGDLTFGRCILVPALFVLVLSRSHAHSPVHSYSLFSSRMLAPVIMIVMCTASASTRDAGFFRHA